MHDKFINYLNDITESDNKQLIECVKKGYMAITGLTEAEDDIINLKDFKSDNDTMDTSDEPETETETETETDDTTENKTDDKETEEDRLRKIIKELPIEVKTYIKFLKSQISDMKKALAEIDEIADAFEDEDDEDDEDNNDEK